jgi:3-oxoacyl-[acyl-carrier protein] reductase
MADNGSLVGDPLTQPRILEPEYPAHRTGNMRILRRSPRLTEVAEVAAFLAWDRAAAMTGTIANVTCGLVPG